MKDRVLEVVKKNIISIICGVIALAAVGVAFTMLAGDQAKLQTELEARKQAYEQLNSLLKKDRTLPTVKLEDSSPEKLVKFPSQKIIDQGEIIVKDLEKASKEIVDAAVAMNTHAPLEPGSLPSPQPAAALNFRELYHRYFPPGQNVSPLQSQFARDLQAGMPPTPDEIRIQVEQRAKTIKEKKLFFLPGGQPGNAPMVQAEIDEMARKLPGELRDQIAQQSKVYINPQTFTPYPAILQASGAPSELDIYLAQLTLWLQQDAVAVVNDANKDSKSIKDSIVKHLVRVTAMPNFVLPAGGAPGADPDAAVPKEPAISPTGRVSNGMYDVFHITIEADVDAAKLPDFLRAIGKNRFMTALWADVKSVDLALERAQGHDYGERPVVNVRAQCEVLYLRAWNKPLMPAEVQAKLGLSGDGAAAPEADAPPGL